jgi:hypothetical protein
MFIQVIDSGDLLAPMLGRTIASGCYPVCHITYNRDTWVKLLQLTSDYGFDEAKLLCQESRNTWVSWVSDQGEVILDRSRFYTT